MTDRIKEAARVIAHALGTYHEDDATYLWPQALEVAQALAEAGMLAPAPLREEWGSEMQNARPGGSSHVLSARDPDNAQWQIDNNPDWATGRIVHRFVTDWETP